MSQAHLRDVTVRYPTPMAKFREVIQVPIERGAQARAGSGRSPEMRQQGVDILGLAEGKRVSTSFR